MQGEFNKIHLSSVRPQKFRTEENMKKKRAEDPDRRSPQYRLLSVILVPVEGL